MKSNGVFTPIKAPNNLVSLENTYIAMYATLNNLINGNVAVLYMSPEAILNGAFYDKIMEQESADS